MPFLYLRDPLFLACFVAYFANRWVVKPNVDWAVAHYWFNDLICIPFWVPIMLWGMKVCGARADDGPPRAHEILIPLLIWAAVFEVWLPQTALFAGRAIADPVDVLCYTLGALAAAVFWDFWYRPREGAGVERQTQGTSPG